MRKLLLSTAFLAQTVGAALAADLPSRKAEPLLPPPPPPMWTGFYAGLNAGYGFGTNSNTQSVGVSNALVPVYTTPTTTFGAVPDGAAFFATGAGLALSGNAPQNQNGFIGGGQIGYNYQWGSNFVIGIEADMQGAGIRGSSRAAGIGAGNYVTTATHGGGEFEGVNTQTGDFNSVGMSSINAGVDWMGTVRGRLGYLWTPTMLVYATGGLTYGGVHANVSNYAVENYTSSFQSTPGDPAPIGPYTTTYIGGGSKSQTLVGWNVGGGLEWMFMPNWSLKAEGLYWNMGNMNVPTAAISAPPLGTPPGLPNTANAYLYATTPQQVIGGTRVNYQGVIARMGVNYHFNFGGATPIVAKY